MKKNLLRIMVVLMALIGSVSLSAATIDILMVKVGDGETMRIALNQQPKVTFEGFNLVLTTNKETITLDGKQLINFTFGNASGIEDLKLSGAPTFYFDDSTLYIFGLVSAEHVALYSVDGKCLFSGVADENGAIEVNIAACKGVFIVKTNSRTIKYAK